MLAVWWGWAGGWERSRAGLETVGVVCKGGGGLFPGIRAGASLKSVGLDGAGARRVLFPGIRAGASLKSVWASGAVPSRVVLFPGIRAGASLKCRSRSSRRRAKSSLPRHSCRGLIEVASTAARHWPRPSTLPRHSCRGLIEVPMRRCRPSWRPLLFPGIRAGASLKC